MYSARLGRRPKRGRLWQLLSCCWVGAPVKIVVSRRRAVPASPLAVPVAFAPISPSSLLPTHCIAAHASKERAWRNCATTPPQSPCHAICEPGRQQGAREDRAEARAHAGVPFVGKARLHSAACSNSQGEVFHHPSAPGSSLGWPIRSKDGERSTVMRTFATRRRRVAHLRPVLD